MGLFRSAARSVAPLGRHLRACCSDFRCEILSRDQQMTTNGLVRLIKRDLLGSPPGSPHHQQDEQGSKEARKTALGHGPKAAKKTGGGIGESKSSIAVVASPLHPHRALLISTSLGTAQLPLFHLLSPHPNRMLRHRPTRSVPRYQSSAVGCISMRCISDIRNERARLTHKREKYRAEVKAWYRYLQPTSCSNGRRLHTSETRMFGTCSFDRP